MFPINPTWKLPVSINLAATDLGIELALCFARCLALALFRFLSHTLCILYTYAVLVDYAGQLAVYVISLNSRN